MQTCIHHLDAIHNGRPSNMWERYISSPMSNLETRRHILRQLSHTSGSQHQVVIVNPTPYHPLLSFALQLSAVLMCA